MAKIYELQPDIFSNYVPSVVEKLNESIYFRGGNIIIEPIPLPLIFTSRHSSKELPSGFHGRCIPLMSDELIESLKKIGVSNLQCFPAEIRSSVDRSIWTNYQAVNVIGKISCADFTSSKFTHIMDRPESDDLPLVAFENLKVNPNCTRDALLFRLAESPGVILIAEKVANYLLSIHSEQDWGITLDER